MASRSQALVMVFVAIFGYYVIEMQMDNGSLSTPPNSFITSEEATYCGQFFFGTPFPRMTRNQTGLVRLCQTQQHLSYQGPAVYATLYDTIDRIPVYSAAVVQIHPNCNGFARPDEKSWNRVSLTLCISDIMQAPNLSVLPSKIGHAGQLVEQCSKFQALNNDYKGNKDEMNIDRGHLNPNAINCQDQEKQMGTFTLTNAAPQYSMFNENAWRQYECVTEYIIYKYAPSERVYVITGTWDSAKDSKGKPLWMNALKQDKNPVKIPGYYWKAVCYPGNAWNHKRSWGFAVIHPNSDSAMHSSPANFMKLQEFSSKYFIDDLFHNACLNADYGPIQKYFAIWGDILSEHCGAEPVLQCKL